MGCVPPEPGFLEGLRSLCDRHGALLVFDEVMTGFRVAWGGAQVRWGVRPDLTILGKVVGGGLPAAAYGGRRDLMTRVAPEGPVYQAGTLSGNPLAMAAGLATLRRLRKAGTYPALEARSRTLADGLAERAARAGVELATTAVGGMFGFFFHPGPVRRFDDARKAHGERFRRFFHAMLEAGIYLPPSPYEACFVSLAHRPADVAATLAASERAFRRAAEGDGSR
jgi:glutamate-1-semialdehyde 2,1-aminomutase